jgi:hypothetical protein
VFSSGPNQGLGALDIGFELTKASPFWQLAIRRPHDGIVEESSVDLGDSNEGSRFSERCATCDGQPNAGRYAHINHLDCKELDHVTIQSADRTTTLIADICRYPDLDAWRSAVGPQPRVKIRPPVTRPI